MPTPLRTLFVSIVATALAGCAAKNTAPPDAHSFANTIDFRVTHAALDLTVDFEAQRLKGSVLLDIDTLNSKANEMTLYTRDLTISKVELLQPVERTLKFVVGERDATLGAPLRIELPRSARAENLKVRIDYETSPSASGLQWLTPPQTAGKAQPFMFSQSQAIHARSWIPLQDTPGVRFTYTARIRTPKEVLAVMSAENDPDATRDGDYEFSMPQAIPSYLLALAVGDLSFQAIGERTGVYAEPSMLDASANEFADTEAMLIASEKLFGPYRWGRYDLLILPPSFMWGGMENPRLSFITPTVIAGDKSLVAIIAHELAHSWSGNLVTNDNWNSVWLNEGFTTYLERRIVEALYGADRSNMEDMLGMQSLKRDIADLESKGDSKLTHLRMDLKGRDPDEAFSDVPYEKGRFFVGFLESRMGREQLDAFLRSYFDRFAFQSVSTEQFLEYLKQEVLSKPDADLPEAEVLAWIDGPGLPDTVVEPQSDAFSKVDAQRDAWLKSERAANNLDTAQWNTQQWLHFLDNFPEDISPERLRELDAAFNLTAATNNEIAHSWLKNAIRADYAPAYPRLETYLISIGRRKLVKPLYDELLKTNEGAARAKAIYAQARPLYQVPLAEQLDKAMTSID